MASVLGVNGPGTVKPGNGVVKSPDDSDIYGTDNADILRGSDTHDRIHGYGGPDEIFGFGASDWIWGGLGADHIDGGDGLDTAIYDDSSEGVTVDLALGRGRHGTAAGDTLVNIEDVGGSYHNDVLIGNEGANSLYGLAGNDRLMGGGGADRLSGGEGFDTAQYWDSSVGVSVDLATGRGFGGTAEGDVLVSIEHLDGSFHDDVLTGNDGSNFLNGGAGNDVLKGAGGDDTLYGFSGDDTLKGGGGADILVGGTGIGDSGIDTAAYNQSPAGVFVSLKDSLTAYGDAAGDALYEIENLVGSVHADVFWGDDNANGLNGMSGADTLKGYGGADTLLGGDGNDNMQGMRGTDTMAGGLGADWFVWNSTDETGISVPAMDLISDFNFAEGDRIDLGRVDASVFADGNQAFSFIGQSAFTGTPGEINFVHVGGETIIQLQTGMDVDVEGGIRLAGLHTPDASWFGL